MNKHAQNLLSVARQALLDDVLPHQSGKARYTALMIAKALAVEIRAAVANPPPVCPVTDRVKLCRDIRAGVFDPGSDGHRALRRWLRASTDHALSISNPKIIVQKPTNQEISKS